MTLAIDITDGRGLSNEGRRELLPNKSSVSRSLHSKSIDSIFSGEYTIYGKSRLNSCTLLTRRS